MALMQLWIESHPVETGGPGQNCTLFDTGQFIIGGPALQFMSQGFFSSAADIWVLVSVVGFFFWLGIDFSHPEREFGRFFLCWGAIYFQRALAIGATRYPLLADAEAYVPENPILGAVLITFGVMKTYSDFMFSGHTATWVVTAFFVHRYANHRFLALVYVVFNCVGPFLLILVEEHYTADVIIGWLIGLWTVVIYHFVNDEQFLSSLRGVWSVHVEGCQQIRLVYPLVVTDAEGRHWEIGGDKRDTVQLVGANTNPPRYALWRLIKWFDGDKTTKPVIRLLQEDVDEISIAVRQTVQLNMNKPVYV